MDVKIKDKYIEIDDENILIMKYKLDKKEKKEKRVKIFGNPPKIDDCFLKSNKDKCQIIFEDKKYEIDEYFNVDNINGNSLELKLLGINKIINASYMFYECSSLIELPDISNWNTKRVTNMNSMFSGCSSLTSLPDISKWKLHNVIDISNMFNGCSSLKYLRIFQWDTAKVTNMKNLFFMFIIRIYF